MHGAPARGRNTGWTKLVREIGVLRGAFWSSLAIFSSSRRQIATEEFLAVTQPVHRFFDEICSDSVCAYVRARDEQAESRPEPARAE